MQACPRCGEENPDRARATDWQRGHLGHAGGKAHARRDARARTNLLRCAVALLPAGASRKGNLVKTSIVRARLEELDALQPS